MSAIALRGSGRPAVDARDYRPNGSQERLFGAKGNEISANDSKDALFQLSNLLNAIQSGEVTMEADDTPKVTLTASQRNEMLRTAFNKGDVKSPEWQAMGNSIAYEVNRYAQRQGFFRNFLDRQEVADGSKPEVTITENHVTAIIASSPNQLQPQYIWDEATFVVPEFEIKAHVRVFNKDLRATSVDLLDRRYQEGLESMMVQEDRLFKLMADEMAGTELPNITFGNSLSPANITYMRQLMETEGVTPTNVLMDITYMSDFITSNDFTSTYDPITQRDILMTGKIFSGYFGLNWFTDSVRKRPNMRVLKKNDFYMFADPATLGSYTDRGPIEAIPVDGYAQGESSRGWYLEETLSMVFTNPSAIIKATRG